MCSAATCYMCDQSEISREHAPPACFFPEAKVVGKNLRKNLITVPSCDAHNSQKSKDDEFMRAIILMQSVDTSPAGQKHFFGKFMRGAQRRPEAYKSFFKSQGTVDGGKKQAFRLDRKRFDECARHVVRALAFHEAKAKLVVPMSITSPNFYSAIQDDKVVPHKPTKKIVAATQFFLQGEPVQGDNPEIFCYRIRFDVAESMCCFAGLFYGFFELYAYASKGLEQSGADV